MIIMRSWKRQIIQGTELPNQERIRTLREKETNKYLGILEADNTKQMEMKERILKTISDERGNSKPSSVARIS